MKLGKLNKIIIQLDAGSSKANQGVKRRHSESYGEALQHRVALEETSIMGHYLF